MEQENIQQPQHPAQHQEKSEQIIEYRTKKSWNEWERILSMTDITTANQKEYISDLRSSFNLDGQTAALIVVHYKSKHRLFTATTTSQHNPSEISQSDSPQQE